MAQTTRHMANRAGQLCRDVAVMLIAGVWRSRPASEINAAVKSQSLRAQVLVTFGALGLLFALSLIAAQFGWIGLLVLWMAVILLVN